MKILKIISSSLKNSNFFNRINEFKYLIELKLEKINLNGILDIVHPTLKKIEIDVEPLEICQIFCPELILIRLCSEISNLIFDCEKADVIVNKESLKAKKMQINCKNLFLN